jgi:hypothetical protein
MEQSPGKPRTFNRKEWRRGLSELSPAARAAMADVAAEKERLTTDDVDRMVAGLGARSELEEP